MKRVLGLTLALVLLLCWMPFQVMATGTVTITSAGTCGESAYWKYTSDGVLTIYGSGPMYDYSKANQSPLPRSFTALVVEEGITSIGSAPFAYYGTSTSYGASKCQSVELPGSLVSIGDYAFHGFPCNIDLPPALETIGDDAFYNSSVTEMIVPDSVVSIGDYAFAFSDLESIVLGSGLESVGSNVFSGCSSLTTVVVEAFVPPAAGTSLFNGCPDSLKIYVPSGAVSLYEAAPDWAAYAAWIDGGVVSGSGSGDDGSSSGGGTADGSGYMFLSVFVQNPQDYYYLNSKVQLVASFSTVDWSEFDQSVTWTVDGSSADTVIDSNGLLIIGANETYSRLTVTATSAAYPSVSAKQIIRVTAMTQEEAEQDPTEDTAITDRLDGLDSTMSNMQTSIDDVSDSVDQLPDDIVNGMQSVMDQQQADAESQGQTSADEVIDMVPDYSGEMLDALGSLVSVLNYDGTEAVLMTPEIKLPGLNGLFPGATLLEPQEIDFEYYFTLLPEVILVLIRALFDVAIVVYCVKELLDLIGDAVNGFARGARGRED